MSNYSPFGRTPPNPRTFFGANGKAKTTAIPKARARATAIAAASAFMFPLLFAGPAAHAALFGLFGDEVEITKTVYEINEQQVSLIKAPEGVSNAHPVSIDKVALTQALSEVSFWKGGGVFRDDEQTRLFPGRMAEVLGSYMADALAQASPTEDVYFVARGYGRVALGLGKERFWNSGRAFFSDGKLNLIIGEHGKIERKDKRAIEGSFGITESEESRQTYTFNAGSRDSESSVNGEVVVANGISIKTVDGESREDWIVIDVDQAARAYAESQIDPEMRRQEQKLEAEAARRTLETREMKAELARLRAEMADMQRGGGGASVQSVEERLQTLDTLKEKGLITEDEYADRRAQILDGI